MRVRVLVVAALAAASVAPAAAGALLSAAPPAPPAVARTPLPDPSGPPPDATAPPDTPTPAPAAATPAATGQGSEPQAGTTPPADAGTAPVAEREPAIAWARSRAVGEPWAGRLVRGVQLPASGPDWFTWDTVLDRRPGRGWRRWGTAALVRTTLRVLRDYRTAHPGAPRVGVGDLSRRRGGPFGPEFGGLGHASHQNGRDVDVWYPRRDRSERRPFQPRQVDRRLAQALVDGFVRAGAEKVFVGPSLDLRGPRGVVVPLVHHDDHLHARIPRPRR